MPMVEKFNGSVVPSELDIKIGTYAVDPTELTTRINALLEKGYKLDIVNSFPRESIVSRDDTTNKVVDQYQQAHYTAVLIYDNE